MTTLGCCGCGPNRIWLRGLLSAADTYPATSPQGRLARQRLAYGVAAAKAAQVGNKAAYSRALSGLQSLGGLGTVPSTADAAALGTGLNRLIGTLSGSAQFRAQLAAASGYINLVLSAAQIGTGIASSACNGCDRTGIDATNLIISIIRTLLSGGTPTVPTMSVDTLNGFVQFCRYKDAVKGGVDAAFGIASVAASAANNAGAASALNAVQGFVDNLLDGICAIPQVAASISTGGDPGNCSQIPNAQYDASVGGCNCKPGFQPSATVANQCDPAPFVLSPTPSVPTVRAVFHPSTSGGGGGAPAPKSSIVLPAAATAAALWWFLG